MARPPSLLDSVVLGFLAERPGYGYDLGKRIDARMGPGWQFKSSGIYAALDRLEAKRFVRSESKGLHAPRRKERVTYHVTEAGTREVEHWLGSEIRKEPVREDVLARIAVSRQEHAPLLLGALEGYERECLDLIASITGRAAADANPWDQLIAEGVQDSILQHLRAELTWVKSMRQRIETFDPADTT